MFNSLKEKFKKIRGHESIKKNSTLNDEMAQIIADIDMDFSISENGSFSRNPKDNLKNKHLMESFSKASRFISS